MNLIMLLLTNNQCIFSMCAFYITSYKYMLCSTAVPKHVSVFHLTLHINLLTLLQLLLLLLSRSGWINGHSSFRENARKRGDRNSTLIQKQEHIVSWNCMRKRQHLAREQGEQKLFNSPDTNSHEYFCTCMQALTGSTVFQPLKNDKSVAQ